MSKKWLSFLVAGILVLSACGDSNESGEQEANAEAETNDAVQDEEVEQAVEEETEEEETEVEESVGNEIVLGEAINVGEYEMTIQDYSLGVDYDGNDALIIEYDWVNNSDESASPFMTFMLKGFQEGVETDEVFMVDGVDLSVGQKEVRPDGAIEGAQTVVGIDDLSKPLELELDELMSFESNPSIAEIDLSTLE